MTRASVSVVLLSVIMLGLIAAPAAVAVSPSTAPVATRTYSVPDSGGTFSAYGVTVQLPEGLQVAVPSEDIEEPVTSFTFMLFAVGQSQKSQDFPSGVSAVKAFGFEINGRYTFNPGTNAQVVFMLDGAEHAISISIKTMGDGFWIWNPMTGAFTDVTEKTGYMVSDGLATAGVVSPIFAWVITIPK